MKSGIYNLGFLGMAKAPDALMFLDWWAARCRHDAIVDIANHKFTDQRWVDMAPAFVPHAIILHDPGYNLAYWNLSHRTVVRKDGAYFANDRPLRFVHFSGVVPSNLKVFSKHQDRFKVADDVGALKPLLEDYVGRLHKNGWKATHNIPYGFGFFTNGRSVHHFMRRVFRQLEEEGLPPCLANPFATSGRYFDELAPEFENGDAIPITFLMHQLWLAREDLQRTFSIETAVGRAHYVQWFVNGGGAEAGFDEVSITAARHILHRTNQSQRLIEPWPAVSRASAVRSTDELDRWLAAPVPLNVPAGKAGVLIPRCFALARIIHQRNG
jgi:hypothetical protein